MPGVSLPAPEPDAGVPTGPTLEPAPPEHEVRASDAGPLLERDSTPDEGRSRLMGKWAASLYGFIEADAVGVSTQSFLEQGLHGQPCASRCCS
jgi:hypothetical protein